MKSTSLILLALTLVNFIDCSGKTPESPKSASPKAFRHQLLVEAAPSSSGYLKRKATSSAEEAQENSEDEEGSSLTHKTPEESAAEVLCTLRTANSTDMFEEVEAKTGAVSKRQRPRKVAAPKAAKAPKALKPLTDATFYRETQKNYSVFFDARNAQTDGVATLVRCLGEGINANLGAFLINLGVRLNPDAPETATALNAAISNTTSAAPGLILMEMIAVAPRDTCRLLLSVEADQEQIDFFFQALMDPETAAFVFSSPELVDVVDLLIRSQNMPNSLAFIFENLHVPFDKATITHFAAVALECNNLPFIKSLLERSLLSIEDAIPSTESNGSNGFNIICSLIGTGRFSEALPLIRRFRYNLGYSHDSASNPNGDILLFVMKSKPHNLDAFRVLLLLGASLDVFHGRPGNMKCLRDSLMNNPSFEAFKNIILDHQAGNLDFTDSELEIMSAADEEAANAPIATDAPIATSETEAVANEPSVEEST
jgi:hypothetical protein